MPFLKLLLLLLGFIVHTSSQAEQSSLGAEPVHDSTKHLLELTKDDLAVVLQSAATPFPPIALKGRISYIADPSPTADFVQKFGGMNVAELKPDEWREARMDILLNSRRSAKVQWEWVNVEDRGHFEWIILEERLNDKPFDYPDEEKKGGVYWKDGEFTYPTPGSSIITNRILGPRNAYVQYNTTDFFLFTFRGNQLWDLMLAPTTQLLKSEIERNDAGPTLKISLEVVLNGFLGTMYLWLDVNQNLRPLRLRHEVAAKEPSALYAGHSYEVDGLEFRNEDGIAVPVKARLRTAQYDKEGNETVSVVFDWEVLEITLGESARARVKEPVLQSGKPVYDEIRGDSWWAP